MSALLVSLFAKFWPAIIGVAGLAGGALFGWIKTKGADAQVAEAGQKVATAQTQVAQVQASAAEANAAAAQATAAAVTARQQIDATVATKTPKEVQDELNSWRQ
ncbi:hypothetical protein GIY62_14830 [Burkholderia plantarii]|uniref:hypothetical protein n=1 Tax=Burkholderia plantarii TaxID=41899 RepID=UPI00272D72DC|nr:hypothetical protein [Burkholderia plantarii]WLE58402.1 hypothetical protein GIY62_14830 [Burkholderia plantarii]